MLHVTAQHYAMSLGCDYQTASRRLRPLPYIKGQNGTHRYALSHALTTLKLTELACLPALFNTAMLHDQTLPNDSEDVANALEQWLRMKNRTHSQQAAISRLENIRRHFAQHLADSVRSSELLRHSEHLRMVLILDDAILRYVVLGDASAFLTEFKSWSLKWAILNAQGELV